MRFVVNTAYAGVLIKYLLLIKPTKVAIELIGMPNNLCTSPSIAASEARGAQSAQRAF
jgi:hypothetical protein